jgi:N6-adenosine-specific RNA methylase IME4
MAILTDLAQARSGRYSIIVADPPWLFSSNSEAKPGRNARRHYPCMPDAEIKRLPVFTKAANSAILFMWTTVPMLERSFPVLDAWGFKYKSQLVWVKSRTSTGFWVRNRHEIVLIATRGRFPCPDVAPFKDSVIDHPTMRHSEKPETLQDMIDEIWPRRRKLEMFARRQRPGWDVFGNDKALAA